MQQIDIKSFTLDELSESLKSQSEKTFRAKQIYKWLNLGVESFDEMTDISLKLREKLNNVYYLTPPIVVNKQVSKVDKTIKYLWKFADGSLAESVLMSYKHGYSACVSTQIGCRMGCVFCASGIGGLVRNLTAGEILDQIIFMQKDSQNKISNIVLMGTGEPLDNYNNVIKFIKLVNSKDGLGIGQRHISLSTSGIVPKINELAKENLQITLSISLHSADNEKRSEIMPVNRSYNVEKLIQACKDYFNKTGRRISYEYAMIDGVSDTMENAKKLVYLLKGQPSHVNLIPLNNVEESTLKTSTRKNIDKFQKYLQENGISATVRRTLGPDIDASCGQLRQRTIKTERE